MPQGRWQKADFAVHTLAYVYVCSHRASRGSCSYTMTLLMATGICNRGCQLFNYSPSTHPHQPHPRRPQPNPCPSDNWTTLYSVNQPPGIEMAVILQGRTLDRNKIRSSRSKRHQPASSAPTLLRTHKSVGRDTAPSPHPLWEQPKAAEGTWGQRCRFIHLSKKRSGL